MIGRNIAEIRKRRELTLSELAHRAGISKSYLSNIERDITRNPSVHVVEKIAFVLHVDLKRLLVSEESLESQQFDEEWMDFINELKGSGIDKEDIQDYKTLIEFIRWKNKK